MDLGEMTKAVLATIEARRDWAGPIVCALAFAESMALVGMVLPAAAVLSGAGVLIGLGILDFWTVALWGTLGAVLGDAVSFWLGRRYGASILGVWPFRHRPDWIERGRGFFLRHGGKSVFIARFFGPLRSTVPLAAGMMGMAPGRFQAANATSAAVWTVALLFSGSLLGRG
jgi:membrane protein DedA with SNARE-associated domain